jgi:uncharacterized integral membrane protein
MLSEARSSPARWAAAGVIPDPITGPVSNGSPAATGSELTPAQVSAPTANDSETRGEHFRRKGRRGRLHGYAIATVALVAFLIALAASNTAHVKVNWVFGSSHVLLVWLVLFAAILSWLLGLAATATFHWRTRAPRRSGGTS